MPNEPITADSLPDYDDWGWDTYWSCSDWVEWHRLNKEKYGLEAANYRFKNAYENSPFLDPVKDCDNVLLNYDFVVYFRENGIYFGLFNDVILSGGEIIGTTGSSINKGFETLKFIPIIIGIGLLLIIVYLLSPILKKYVN